MKLNIYQVDAFSQYNFSGNPAAVCPLEAWLSEPLMQSIAAENNLSETVFYVANELGFDIRWFTPVAEVNLCGHATLAAAYVLYEIHDYQQETILFNSKSGPLHVYKKNNLIYLDFPAEPPTICEVPDIIQSSLAVQPIACLKENDYMFIFEHEQHVREFTIDMNILKQLDLRGVIISAPAKNNAVDFVSRFFAPKYGIEEDPVTGSAHTQLVPYWSNILQKKKLFAQQVSQRGGDIFCELHDNRVHMGGHAHLFLEGHIHI